MLIVTSGQLQPQVGQLLGDILGTRLGDRAVEGDNMRDELTDVCGADDTDIGPVGEPGTVDNDPEDIRDGNIEGDPETGTVDNDPENIRDGCIEGETETPAEGDGNCTGDGDIDTLLTDSCNVILIPIHHIEFKSVNVELVSTKTHSSPALFVVKLNVLLIPGLIEDTFRVSNVKLLLSGSQLVFSKLKNVPAIIPLGPSAVAFPSSRLPNAQKVPSNTNVGSSPDAPAFMVILSVMLGQLTPRLLPNNN